MGSPGAALLREVAMALPATAHLVLSGREVPELPLARHEAAGELVRIGSADLAFTEVEVSALARRLRRDPSVASAVQGWPALVRLAFAAGPRAPWQYAREEVLNRLPDPQRRALAALGTATAGEVAVVTGGPVALDDLVRRIPLVGELDNGRYRAHDLWTDAMSHLMPERETRTLREGAAATLAARGDLARAGQLAHQAQDWRLLAELAVHLVHTTLSALPRTIAERWLGLVPPPVVDEPAFVLLRAAVTHAGDFTDPDVDPMLDQAWHDMLDRHDEAGATATLGQADPEAALAHVVQAPVLEVPRALALSTWWFHYHCLNMCGRSGEAAELADRTLGDASEERCRLAGAVARWLDGNPADLDLLRGSGRATAAVAPPPTGPTARDAFVARALSAVIASSYGEGALLPALPCGDPEDKDNPRDAMLACVARAAVAVARDDECAARQAYAGYLADWPFEIRFTERHLRRSVALGYVLSDRLRAHWDGVDLGPSHRAARTTARALVLARAGDLTAGVRLNPAHALCFLPLPWSVELAVLPAPPTHRIRIARASPPCARASSPTDAPRSSRRRTRTGTSGSSVPMCTVRALAPEAVATTLETSQSAISYYLCSRSDSTW